MRSIILLTLSLSVFQASVAVARAEPVTCPSDDVFGGIDEAHLVLELPKDWSYHRFVKKALKQLKKFDDARVEKIEFQEKTLGGVSRPVFSYPTGQIRPTFPMEEVTEMVVIRPLEDCSYEFINKKPETKLYVVSRAFSDDELNRILVGLFLELKDNVIMHPISQLGQDWVCTNDPQHPSCAALPR